MVAIASVTVHAALLGDKDNYKVDRVKVLTGGVDITPFLQSANPQSHHSEYCQCK